MLEAINTQTGQRIVLPGSRWSGLAVTDEQAAEMTPYLRCVNGLCARPVRVKPTGRALKHENGEYCLANSWPGPTYRFWVREDILGDVHPTGANVASAKIVHATSGMGVAVRPVSRDGWRGGGAEHGADAAAGVASMWLVDEDSAKSDLAWTSGWVGKLIRRSAKTSGYPISVGVLTDRYARFVGDVALERTEDGLMKTRVVMTTPPVPVEALRFWAKGGATPAPAELAKSLQILDFAAQRRIRVVSG